MKFLLLLIPLALMLIPISDVEAHENTCIEIYYFPALYAPLQSAPMLCNGVWLIEEMEESKHNQTALFQKISNLENNTALNMETAYNISQIEGKISKNSAEITIFKPWVMLVESLNQRLSSAESTITNILNTLAGYSNEIDNNTQEINHNTVVIQHHSVEIAALKTDVENLYALLNFTIIEPIP